MAAIGNIVINDAQASPVAHTFAPAKTQADMALLEDRVSGVFVGYNKLTFTLSRPSGAVQTGVNRNLKLTLKIETPKLESVNPAANGFTPAPTVSYRPTVELTAVFPERCSLQDRKDLQAYVRNVLSNAFVTDAFEKYELPY